MLLEIQKKNLTKLLERYSFEHLRPMPEVYEIQHPQEELFATYSSTQKRRKIFFKVKYTLEEMIAIEETKTLLKSKNIHEKYPHIYVRLTDPVILKHVYSSGFDLKNAVERLASVIDYHKSPITTKLDDQTIKNLEVGCVYSYGQDKGMRPLIVVRADKFNYNYSVDENYNLVYYVMLVVLGYKMVPYHAQKCVTIMDFNNMNLTDIPFRYLYDVFTKMNLYYCANNQRVFVFNSKGIGTLWSLASTFLPEYQRKRVIFIEKGQQKEMLNYFEDYQLEKRYGGKLQNLNTFWPPKSTNEDFDQLNEERSQTTFYSVENNIEFFNLENENKGGLCGEVSCQCDIY